MRIVHGSRRVWIIVWIIFDWWSSGSFNEIDIRNKTLKIIYV